MSDTLVHTVAVMGTVVTIQVVGHGANNQQRHERAEAVQRAAAWFQQINDTCTRFDPQSELRQLTAQIGTPVPVSTMLYEAVRFALAVAEASGGAFDPAIGHRMEMRGFNREYRTGTSADSGIDAGESVSYRDVRVDPDERTITLFRPLLLDLGAVAKGLAIDMAVHELQPFTDFVVDAGGDLYLGGHNAAGDRWSVGIRHPRDAEGLIATLYVSDAAVCTSGDYERRTVVSDGEHHIIDPRSGRSAAALASVTVLAPSAMVADALATAAFVLGPAEGVKLLEQHDVEGLLVTPALEQFKTPGFCLD